LRELTNIRAFHPIRITHYLATRTKTAQKSERDIDGSISSFTGLCPVSIDFILPSYGFLETPKPIFVSTTDLRPMSDTFVH
jgi:hypothetical protein